MDKFYHKNNTGHGNQPKHNHKKKKEIHPALDKNYTERMKQNKEKKSKVKFLLTNVKDRKWETDQYTWKN